MLTSTQQLTLATATVDVLQDALTTGGQDARITPDVSGGLVQSSGPSHPKAYENVEMSQTPGVYANGQIIPTDDELKTLRRVAGTMPPVAYMLCAVEFAERASYYGCNVSGHACLSFITPLT